MLSCMSDNRVVIRAEYGTSIRIPTIIPMTPPNIPRILLRIHHMAKKKQLRLSRTACLVSFAFG
jgi:hypothetical protein